MNNLLNYYGLEGMAMPYTMEDFERDTLEDLLRRLTPEKRLQGLTPEQVLAALSPEQLLAALPREVIENYLKKLKGPQDPPATP